MTDDLFNFALSNAREQAASACFTPEARRTDPATSHKAAKQAIKTVTDTVRHVLNELLVAHDDGLTDLDIQTAARDLIAQGKTSASALRSRRKELCDMNLVMCTGQIELPNSKRAFSQWSLTDKGRHVAMLINSGRSLKEALDAAAV